jgi:hypothetical protein
VEEAERLLILKTLEATSNNKTRAAEILGISLKTLHNKLKEYGSAAAEATPRARRKFPVAKTFSHACWRTMLSEPLFPTSLHAATKDHHRAGHHSYGDGDGAAFSYLYISQILRLRINNANETATNLTHQLAYAVANAVPDFTSTSVDTSNSAAMRRALADYVPSDVALNNLLQSYTGDWRFIYDVTIVDVTAEPCCTPMPAWWAKIASAAGLPAGRERAFLRPVSSGFHFCRRLRRHLPAGIERGALRHDPHRRANRFSEKRSAGPADESGLYFDRADLRLFISGGGNLQPSAGTAEGRSTAISIV